MHWRSAPKRDTGVGEECAEEIFLTAEPHAHAVRQHVRDAHGHELRGVRAQETYKHQHCQQASLNLYNLGRGGYAKSEVEKETLTLRIPTSVPTALAIKANIVSTPSCDERRQAKPTTHTALQEIDHHRTLSNKSILLSCHVRRASFD
jgi:hypothetical protein